MLAKAVYLTFCHPVCSANWKLTLFDGGVFTRVLAGDTIIRDEFNRTRGKIIDVSADEVIAGGIYQKITK